MKKFIFSMLAICVSALAGQTAMAQDGYRISPGDTLTVEVVQDPTLNRDLLVLPDGSVSFPFAGSLRVRGLTTGQVQGQIASGIASNFATQPNVFVSVRQVGEPAPVVAGVPAAARTIDIYIQGEVNSPGVVEVPPGTTLIQALSLHGGFTNFAATRRIQLRRTHPRTGQISTATLNYRAVAAGGVLSHDPVLAEGDVILVPQRRLFE